MNISQNDLNAAVEANLITRKQADQLIEFWKQRKENIPSFRFKHVLYYFGGLIAISAISLFVTQAWNLLIGTPLFLLSALFFILGLLLMRYFLNQRLPIPAGIMATFSLAAIPLALYNAQSWLGFSPMHYDYASYHYFVSWFWLPMELSTLLAGTLMFYFYRFPFLLFPISITLWYMSMDLYFLFHATEAYNWQQQGLFSMYFGLIVLLYAFYIDIKHNDEKQDYAFWLYLFGVVAFWGGLSSQSSHSELNSFIYGMINIAMILLSVFLNRRVFMVFGGIGLVIYLSHLAFSVFAGSLSFPVVLAFIGILLILAATRWTKVEKKLFAYFRPCIPAAILNRRKDL